MEQRIYAAIDANLNRALEGIRVCEDVMRFCLRRTDLSTRFKETRHLLADAAKRFPPGMLLHGRDVEADGQKFVDLGGEGTRGSLADLLSANLHRAMEAVRSLEEFSKLAFPGLNGNPFQRIRFTLYELERDTAPLMKRGEKIDRFSRSLYAILDSSYVSREKFGDAAGMMIRGGRVHHTTPHEISREGGCPYRRSGDRRYLQGRECPLHYKRLCGYSRSCPRRRRAPG